MISCWSDILSQQRRRHWHWLRRWKSRENWIYLRVASKFISRQPKHQDFSNQETMSSTLSQPRFWPLPKVHQQLGLLQQWLIPKLQREELIRDSWATLRHRLISLSSSCGIKNRPSSINTSKTKKVSAKALTALKSWDFQITICPLARMKYLHPTKKTAQSNQIANLTRIELTFWEIEPPTLNIKMNSINS